MTEGDGQPVALVSGASRGIGREIARQLAATARGVPEAHLASSGFHVLAGARDPDGADIGAQDGVEAVPLDVADQTSVDALRERIERDPGRLDALVNNAGIMPGSYGDRVSEVDFDTVRAALETNFYGALRLTQAMLPLLRRSEHARIVNVSSGAGQLDDMQGGIQGYRVSKAALNALTRITSAEEDSILVNSICPGWVRTDMGTSGASRSVEQGADSAVWLATIGDDGPTGGFFRDRKPIPW